MSRSIPGGAIKMRTGSASNRWQILGMSKYRGSVTMEEFRPCPRCGSKDISLYFDGQLFSVCCCDCNLSTDCYIGDYEAVDAWNHGPVGDELP